MTTISVTPSAGGENRTPHVVELLRTCGDDTCITFAPGVYDFYADGCYTDYLTPVCNLSSDKRLIVSLARRRNIVIEGNGATFLFHDRVFPFAFRECEGVTLRNITVNFSFPRYCAAYLHCDEDGVLFEFDKAACECRVNEQGNLLFISGDTVFSTGEQVFFVDQKNLAVGYLAVGRLHYDPKALDLPADFTLGSAEERDNGIYVRYAPGSERPFKDGPGVISFDEKRQNDVCYFERCTDVKVEGLTVYRSAGMGIVSQLCHNVELSHIRFQAGEHGDERHSTTADGLFFTNVSGKVWIHDCRIEDTMDDAVSIHTIYGVVETVGERRVLVRMLPAHSGYNPFIPGDTLRIVNKDGEEAGTCTVASSLIESDTCLVQVELTEPVQGRLSPGDQLENHGRSPEVVIENCLFRRFPHIRFGSAHPIVFRQNTVEDAHGVLINDLPLYWKAYGPSENVYLIGNTFNRCSTGVRSEVEGSKATHGTVRVQKNQFVHCKKSIMLDRVRTPIISNNALIGCPPPEILDCGALEEPPMQQLLMRRDTPASFAHTPLPEGYTRFTFHRGGDERMSLDEYKEAWFAVSPGWTQEQFDWFYQDTRIPEDGFFLIKDPEGHVVGHSNIQLNEHTEGSATVHFVEVKPQARGLRLGYCTSEMVLDYVEAHGIPTTYLTTDEFRMPAIRIYHKLGFRPVLCDETMRERWLPILRILGCGEVYDENEQLIRLF